MFISALASLVRILMCLWCLFIHAFVFHGYHMSITCIMAALVSHDGHVIVNVQSCWESRREFY